MDFTFDLSQELFSSADINTVTNLLLKVFSYFLDEGKTPQAVWNKNRNGVIFSCMVFICGIMFKSRLCADNVRFLIVVFLFFPAGIAFLNAAAPDWFIPLRDAVYEQKLSADEIAPLYREISKTASSSLSGPSLYVLLSRCEYMMGRAYQFENRKNEAILHFDEGIKFAEKALESQKSAEAWVMLAENISQSCVVRPASYAIANGMNVEKYSKNALAINNRNAAAQFMIAARWVYAPSPFHNYNRGIEMLNAIINAGDMQKDDMFNIYSSIGYAYMQKRNNAQARTWFSKSLEIYPTNQYVKSIFEKL